MNDLMEFQNLLEKGQDQCCLQNCVAVLYNKGRNLGVKAIFAQTILKRDHFTFSEECRHSLPFQDLILGAHSLIMEDFSLTIKHRWKSSLAKL